MAHVYNLPNFLLIHRQKHASPTDGILAAFVRHELSGGTFSRTDQLGNEQLADTKACSDQEHHGDRDVIKNVIFRHGLPGFSYTAIREPDGGPR